MRFVAGLVVLAAASAIALAEPTAHDPGYASRQVWPDQQPRPEYMLQRWDPAPLYVWARPGESGNLDDAANWLVDGKPAAAPPDEKVDVYLPDADDQYRVRAGSKQSVRHLTVGRNAGIMGRHRNELQIWGNGWVREGGFAYYIAFRGPGNCFFRVDGSELPSPDNKIKFGHTGRGGGFNTPSQLSHKLQICKYGDGSTEFIGHMGASDEIMVQYGRLIVSGELRWSGATNKGALEVYDGGVLELQSGARVGPMCNQNGKSVYNIDVYRNGTIQAGSPHRPLTEDAKIILGAGPDNPPGKVGLFAAAGSMIRVYSKDPTRHRLVVTSTASEPDFYDGSGDLMAKRKDAAGKHTVLQLAGDVQLDGVLFDYMHEGGIKLLDPQAPKAWQHVAYGPNNAARGAALFGKLTEDANTYYHGRGDAQSEWGLTKTAVASMEAYMRQKDPYQISSSPPAADASKDKQLKRPKAIEYRKPIDVELTCKLGNATVHYTLDGSEPTQQSTRYAGPIHLTSTTRIRARAFAPGKQPSPVFNVSYAVEAEKQ